ncbi:MAG: hypothetical protein H0U71_08640 [Gammaproteobacteria bacterium]|nr:hypothetical protein [Gammaproteobacteria bacterium]
MQQNQYQAAVGRSELHAAIKFLFIIGWAIYGEYREENYSRALAALLLTWLFLSYNQEKNLQQQQYQRTTERETNTILEDRISLCKAARSNDADKIEGILRRRGKVFIGAGASGKNALHFAVKGQAFAAINFLLDVQADINTHRGEVKGLVPDILNHQDENGNTPAHLALLDVIEGVTEDFKVFDELVGNTLVPINDSLQNNLGQTIPELRKEAEEILSGNKASTSRPQF